MRTWLAIWQCSALLGAVAAHADPSAKPTGRLRLPARFGDCKGCTVVAEPKTLSSHDDWVTVTVTGVQFGQPSDWVGVFAPKDISPEGALLRFPVRWQLAGTTCAPRGSTAAAALRAPPSCAGEACCAPNGYATTGNATLRFQLVNLRTSFVFALVQGTAQFPLLVARSGLVAFAQPAAPTGVHLALTAASDEMRVSWAAPAASSPAAVRWGTAPGAFAFAAAAASAHYNASDLCAVGGSAGGPAATLGFRDPGALNSAVMRGLAPGTRYWYSVGSDVGGWSHDRANFSFATSAAAAAPAAPTAATAAAAAAAPPATTTAATGVRGRSARIFAFGDMGKAPSAWDGSLEHSWDNAGAGELGSWNVSRLLAAEAARAAPDFVLHIGDIAYAVGYLSEWDEFMAQIEPVAAAGA
jgi:acid phosphatase type 7